MNELIEKRVVACYQMVDNAIKNLAYPIEDAIDMFGDLFYDKLELADKNVLTLLRNGNNGLFKILKKKIEKLRSKNY